MMSPILLLALSCYLKICGGLLPAGTVSGNGTKRVNRGEKRLCAQHRGRCPQIIMHLDESKDQAPSVVHSGAQALKAVMQVLVGAAWLCTILAVVLPDTLSTRGTHGVRGSF